MLITRIEVALACIVNPNVVQEWLKREYRCKIFSQLYDQVASVGAVAYIDILSSDGDPHAAA
jgi:hypothetical protein